MYLDLRSSLFYLGDSRLLAVLYAFNGFYALICNRLIIDLGPLIVFFEFHAGV